MGHVILTGIDDEPPAKPLRQSDMVSVLSSSDPELLVPTAPPGMAATDSGIVVPEGYMRTPEGLLVEKRERHMCRYCGAVFGLEKGCVLHETQCREQARSQWTAAAMSGPASTDKTAEELVEYVANALRAHEKRPRTVWREMGDPTA
jgi:hypothetical protein